jgi:FMN-dependent NADH-azoreductase
MDEHQNLTEEMKKSVVEEASGGLLTWVPMKDWDLSEE